MAVTAKKARTELAKLPAVDWRRTAYLLQLSRKLDALEETTLVPERKVLYQFSARGHDMAQILLGLALTDPHDAVCGYYRSRPILLALGVDPDEALASSMARAGGYSDGRDIGIVFNHPNPNRATALPMCGGVGTQYTPTCGWVQAVAYPASVLDEKDYANAIAVALGGDGSFATNGFWSALTIATTQHLPMLFYVEDNGYGISVPSQFQTPGGDIAANLASFRGLNIVAGDGTDPAEAASLIDEAVRHVRQTRGPALLRLRVPRLQGHSFQDTQAYAAEGSTENLFMVRNGVLHTPDLANVLEGITRDTIIELAADLGIKVIERRISRDEIYTADEAFFTGTAAELTPIRELDNRPIGEGKPGPITRALQDSFFATVQGANKRRTEWLSPVRK